MTIKLIAKIVSYLFHPLLMPTYGILVFFGTDSYLKYTLPFEIKKFVILLITTSTFFIPALTILFLWSKKKITTIEVNQRKERVVPYAVVSIFYILTLFILNKAPVPVLVFNFIFGATVSVILTSIVNIKWKISAHMVALGGVIGALISVSLSLNIYVTDYILVAILVTGIVASARLLLGVHSPKQVYAGFFLGVLCQVTSLYY